MAEMLIRNVRPMRVDGAVDLRVIDGRIDAMAAALEPASPDAVVIDGGGRLLIPSFVDAHTHMDKTLMGMGWYRNQVGPRLIDRIDNERALRRERGIDAYQQSTRQARASLAAGTTHVRTFVDIDTECRLSGFEGVMRTREDFRDVLTIQVVAFPQSGMLVRPGTVELMEEALRQGAHVVGGLDPSSIDRDPAHHLDIIFDLAETYDVDIDIHLHEPGELGAFSVELIAERTKALSWQGRVVISHAICLGGVEDTYLNQLIELLLENDIVIMSHGPGGLRAAPSVKRLREAGVRMCTGNDGIRDAWGPLNTSDMLRRVYNIAYRNGLRCDDEIEMVIDIATHGSAEVIGVAGYGLAPGTRADFVLVDGETHVEAVVDQPPRWLVVANGHVVAHEGQCLVGGAV